MLRGHGAPMEGMIAHAETDMANDALFLQSQQLFQRVILCQRDLDVFRVVDEHGVEVVGSQQFQRVFHTLSCRRR